MLKISLLAMTGILLLTLMKNAKSEAVPFLILGISGIIMMYLVVQLGLVLEMFKEFQRYTKMDNRYFSSLIKMVGIAYVSEFTSGICKDCGYGAIASQVEMVGKVLIMVMSFPVIMALLEAISLFF